MGCSSSKGNNEIKAQDQPKPKDEKKTEEPKAEATKEKDSEPWASKEKTIAYIMSELNISEESATKIYTRANKDGDNQMDQEEVKALLAMIDEANKELKPLFEKADANKSGKVTITEATKVLKEIYPTMTEKPMKTLFKKFDDGDGNVRYGEFIVFNCYLKDAEKKFRPQFEKCDANNTGTVTLTEAATVLQEAFPKLDERAIKGLLYKYDSGDAIVQYEEFVLFYANLQMARAGLSSKFDELDKNGDGQLSRKSVMKLISEETGMDEDECKSLVYSEDEDNDGSISKAEFIDLWSNLL